MRLPDGPIWQLNPFAHPIRALKLAIRLWSLREDTKQTDPITGDFEHRGEIPPQLQHFEKGEILPWKGVQFRVGKVIGEPFPMVILVPVNITHGAKLRTLRHFRDEARARKAVRI